jgi:crotonobetainyl-CoA:carnitine CoA-transferase CaiB-like acyl-CoA transferase
MTGALEGIRVLDLSRALAGPFAAMTLGDMGADVVKIEEPGIGDTTRGFPPFWNGESTYFLSTNRNKRAITLDLTKPAGQDILRRLAGEADILVESFRAGAMERWNAGWDTLREINPRLIYCAISAAGREGPEKDRAGVDLLMQAYAGLMSITGDAAGKPVRTGTSVVDLSTGANAAQGILAALYVRERTGKGQRVDVSLLGSTIAWMTYHAVAYFATGNVPQRMGSSHPSVAPYGAFPTRDGFLVVAIAFDSHWRKFCNVTGNPEYIDHPKLNTNAARIENREFMEATLTAILSERSALDWAGMMDAAGIPCSPIHSIDQVMSLPQALHMGYVAAVPHPEIDDLRMPGIHIGFSDSPSSIRLPPPRLGEHNQEVLTEAGFTSSEIEAFESAGVI